jgi:hypothetical protein
MKEENKIKRIAINILLTILSGIIYNNLNQKPASILGVILSIAFIWSLVLIWRKPKAQKNND